jgi:hypothetical protein
LQYQQTDHDAENYRLTMMLKIINQCEAKHNVTINKMSLVLNISTYFTHIAGV